jgi:hypothetical protein
VSRQAGCIRTRRPRSVTNVPLFLLYNGPQSYLVVVRSLELSWKEKPASSVGDSVVSGMAAV